MTAYGMCTACWSVEVALNNATGTRDLSDVGEAEDDWCKAMAQVGSAR